MKKQSDEWAGKMGEKYIKRNSYTCESFEKFYKKTYGVGRLEMNKTFLNFLPKQTRILEVGANIGLQLAMLSKMGFTNLYGIEINELAIKKSQDLNKKLPIHIIKASALEIPFKTDYFDLVFTSGVLIHINPKDIKRVLSEIHRCASRYIWGFEYYTEKGYKEIIYRGKNNLLWKTNFKKLYTKHFSDLKIIRAKKYKYVNNEEMEDEMFLLSKRKI